MDLVQSFHSSDVIPSYKDPLEVRELKLLDFFKDTGALIETSIIGLFTYVELLCSPLLDEWAHFIHVMLIPLSITFDKSLIYIKSLSSC